MRTSHEKHRLSNHRRRSAPFGGRFSGGHLPQRELTEAPSRPPESPFSERVAAVGLVEASTENIAVGTHIAGIVHQVFVSAGQRVSTGDPLFEIDNRHLRAQLQLQRTALAVADAELADLENQLGRAETLARQKVISLDELDRRRFAARTLRARVAQADAAIKASETEIARSRVTAPVDGEILKAMCAPANSPPPALHPSRCCSSEVWCRCTCAWT